MFALVLQIPNENRTGFSIVHLYKRPRTENTACAKRVRPFAKIRTGESKSKLACILPRGRIFDEVKDTNNSGKVAETGPPEAFFQPNVIFFRTKMCENKKYAYICSPKTTVLDRENGASPSPATKKERCRSGRSGRTRNAVYGQLYRGFESLPLRQETLNDSELTETSGYKAGRFSFSGPARCDSRSGFPPHRPHRPRRPRRLLRFRPDRPDRTPGYASNRPVCFGAFH